MISSFMCQDSPATRGAGGSLPGQVQQFPKLRKHFVLIQTNGKINLGTSHVMSVGH